MWDESVDGYCERIDASFWSEPVNAITNLAFLVAAFWLFRQTRREQQWGQDSSVTFLIVVLFLIGIGSFLFHTFATRWAGLADVLPIFIFIMTYVYVALRRFFGWSWWLAILGPAALMAQMPLYGALGLGGAAGYLPALVGLLVLGSCLLRADREVAISLLTTAAIFALSLSFRSIDELICSQHPQGTHWIWHCLNALTLYRVTQILAQRWDRPPHPTQ